MSYATGEAAVLTILRLHADYSSSNTSRGDWRILDSGRDSHYVVLRMGRSTNEQSAITQAMTTWQTDIMAYERYAADGPSAITLQGHVQTLLEHVEKYPTLQGVVTDAQIVGISEMEQLQMVANGPIWLRTIISLQWQEEREITYS